MHLSRTILADLDAFHPDFRRPTWARALDLVAGTFLARGWHTVAAALHACGCGDDPVFRCYHEILSRAAWSPLRAARRLLGALVAALGLAQK